MTALRCTPLGIGVFQIRIRIVSRGPATDKETESPTLPEDKPEDNGLGDNTSEGLNNFSLSPTDIEANVTVNITTNIIYIEETEPNAVYEESPLESMPVEAPVVSEAA